jgi:acetylornithine/succinyldiaminopimelate/putrescine aminotransferase
MLALEFRFGVRDIIMEAMNRGVLVLDAGRTIIRFLPPLVIKKEQLDQAVTVLREIVEGKELERESP